MIEIRDKSKCCGCEACVQVCPKGCISLEQDSEGFFYPKVNKELCVECGMCERVCPMINQGEEREPLKILAAKNLNEEIRKKSSSGGVFTLLAELVLREGGVVFGAGFDENWGVEHSYCETEEGLAAFRGSKYVQSRVGNSFREVKRFLNEGRKVLFSGTPCQVSGLRLFLGKEYENLLLVDIICMGVPSPRVWNRYLEEFRIKNRVKRIDSISFRDKTQGWRNCSMKISGINKNGDFSKNSLKLVNPFLKGFAAGLYQRPACYNCPAKEMRSGSDIKIADFWRVEENLPEFSDDLGVSLILIGTQKGTELINELVVEKKEVRVSLNTIFSKSNRSYYRSYPQHKDRANFFRKFNKSNSSFYRLIARYVIIEPTFWEKVIYNLKHIKHRFIKK